MYKIKFKYRVILSFLSVILTPLIITLSFLFFYGRHLYLQDRDSFTMSTETTAAINEYVNNNWDLVYENNGRFHDGMRLIIGDKPIGIRIINTDGVLVYDSSETKTIDHFDLYTKIVPGLEGSSTDSSNDLLRYTIGQYIYVDDEVVGIKLYTYPPPPEFISKLIRLLLLTFLVGITTLLGHVALSVVLISRRVTKPLKELEVAINKISQNDFDFNISYCANDELGNLCQAFQIMKCKLKDLHEREVNMLNTKKQLIAAISHDLRTPITSIKGYVEALEDGLASDPKTFNQYLSIIHNKVDGLNVLIDDLFNLSKLDLGQLNFSTERIHVKTFAQNFYMDIKEEAGWQQKIIHKDFSNIEFTIIDADPSRLEQALNNIVINAFKYSSKEVVFKCFSDGEKVYFSIVDDGPGIPSSQIPLIFNKFYKIEKARTTNTGSGLGLSIAKSIITNLQGDIDVKNNEDTKGATFTISLPIVS